MKCIQNTIRLWYYIKDVIKFNLNILNKKGCKVKVKKFKTKNAFIFLLMLTLLFSNIGPQYNVYAQARETENNLPEKIAPEEIKVTANKYVPRVGDGLTMYLDNYQFENKVEGLANGHYLALRLHTADYPAQTLKDVKIPKFKIESYIDGNWEHYGYEIDIELVQNSWYNKNESTVIKTMIFPAGEEDGFTLTNEELLAGVEKFNTEHREKYKFEDFRQFILTFKSLDENGNVSNERKNNKVVQYGPVEYNFDITDKKGKGALSFARLLGAPYPQELGTKTEYEKIWLNYETSDISLTEIEPEKEYTPWDEAKLNVVVNNKSEFLPNKRLVSGVDYGKKDIVENPTNTEGTPDVTFDVPNNLGDGQVLTEEIKSGDSVEYEVDTVLPDDFTNYLNDDGDKLVLTPYLYTSNQYTRLGASKMEDHFHPEEREYNEGIELLVKSIEVNYNDNGSTAGTAPVDSKSPHKIVSKNEEAIVLDKGDLVNGDLEFKGWSTEKDSETAEYQPGDKIIFDKATVEGIKDGITLYAVWGEPTEEYRVTYNGNTNDSGTAPTDSNSPYAKDSEVTVLPKGDLSRTGYTFKGWNTKSDGSGTSYKAGDTFKITANTTLYAQWEKDSDSFGGGWTWGGSSTSTSSEKLKVEETLTHTAYLNGYPDNTIRPQGSITRAEVAAIFARLKVGEANITSGSTNYSDVNSSDWYSKYIAFVTDNKIMEGYEDGSFRPNDKITRAEFTAVVARYNSLADTTSTFEDVIGHWAAGYIGSVTSKGWINGYPDGTFKPEKDISREEVATMVNKMLDRKVDKDGLNNLSINSFTDLDNSSWSYFDIVEASNSHKSVRRTLGDIMENWKELIK